MRRHEGHHDRAHHQVGLGNRPNIIEVLAITAVVASTFVSCGKSLGEAEKLNLAETPVQRVDNVFAVQSKNGEMEMRLEAGVMERYSRDGNGRDYFPKGISVFSYTDEGLLESVIIADEAEHVVPSSGDEVWKAYGNVILHNVIKQETMETDTIFWDSGKKEIYTDCYVKMYSRDAFAQGYGMRSDDRMRNSKLFKPFNNFVVVERDTTAVIIDSVNFIGPFPKK